MQPGYSHCGPRAAPPPTFFSTVPQGWPLGWDATSDHNRVMTAISSNGPEDTFLFCFVLLLYLTRGLFGDSEVLCCSSRGGSERKGSPPAGVLGRGLDPAPFPLIPRSQRLGGNSVLRPQGEKMSGSKLG